MSGGGRQRVLGRDEKDESERPSYGSASASSGSGGSSVQRTLEPTGTVSAGGGGGSAGAGLLALREPGSASDRNTYQPPESSSTPDVLRQARALVQQAIGGGTMQTRMTAVLSSLVAEHAQVVVPYRAEAILSFTSPQDYELFGLDEYPDREKRSERYRIHAIPCVGTVSTNPSSEVVLLALNDNNPCVRRVNYINIAPVLVISEHNAKKVYNGSEKSVALVAHPRRRSRIGLPPPTLMATGIAADAKTANGFVTRTWVEAKVSVPPGVEPTLPILGVYAATSTAPAPLPLLDTSDNGVIRALTTSDSGRFLFFRTGRHRLRNSVVCIVVVDLQTRIQQTLFCEKRPPAQGGGIFLIDVASSLKEVESIASKQAQPAERIEVPVPTLRRIIGSHDVMIEDDDGAGVDTMVRLRWNAQPSPSWSTPDPVYDIKQWPELFSPRTLFFDTTIGILRGDLMGMVIYSFPLASERTWPWESLTTCIWQGPDMTGINSHGTPTVVYWSLATGRVIIAVQVELSVYRGGMFAEDSPSMDARTDIPLILLPHDWFGYYILLLEPDLENTVTAAKRKALRPPAASAAQEEDKSSTKQRRLQSADVKDQPKLSSSSSSGLKYQGWIRGTLSAASSSDWAEFNVLAMCADGHFYALYTNEYADVCVLVKARMVNRRVQFVARTDARERDFAHGEFQVNIATDRVVSVHPGPDRLYITAWQFQPGSSRVRVIGTRTITYAVLVATGVDASTGSGTGTGTGQATAPIARERDIKLSALSSDGYDLAVLTYRSPSILQVYELWSKPETEPLTAALLKHDAPIESFQPVRPNGFVTYTYGKSYRMWQYGENSQWKGEEPMPYTIGNAYTVRIWFREFCLLKLPNNQKGGYAIGMYTPNGIVEDYKHPLARLLARSSMNVIEQGDDTTIAFCGRLQSTLTTFVTDEMLQHTESDTVTRVGTAVDAPDDCDGIWDDMDSDGMAGLSFQPGFALSDAQRARAFGITEERDTDAAESGWNADRVGSADSVIDNRQPNVRGIPLILYVCNYAGGPVRTVAATATATASLTGSTAK